MAGRAVLDLPYEEDSNAEVDMNVVMDGNRQLIEIQATGESCTFSRPQMNKLLDLAESGIQELVELQNMALD